MERARPSGASRLDEEEAARAWTTSGACPAEGGTVGSDYSALFYVLVGIILIVKFYVGSCGCG